MQKQRFFDNFSSTSNTGYKRAYGQSDYYCFGSIMPGRHYQAAITNKHRYGFNGKENDNEVKGDGNQQDFGSRIYDSRIGKFLSVDSKTKEYPYWSTYAYAGNNPIKLIDVEGEGPEPPHHIFLTTVAIEIYDFSKTQGASTRGALLVLAQASLESGYGQSAIKYNDFNLFGVMGTPSKRKTSHGSVKDYSNLGKYQGALKDYFRKIDKLWPDFKDVIKKDDFSSSDIDEALNTGDSYPTDAERMKGKYAYNADMDALGENHYGESLLKQTNNIKGRLEKSINYQVEKNNSRIKEIDNTLKCVGILTDEGKNKLTSEKNNLTNQNKKLTDIKTELNASK